MKIEAGKFYKTRDGRKVRIYAVDGGGSHPIHGAIYDCRTDQRIIGSWTSGGFDDHECSPMHRDIIAEWADAPEIRWERIPPHIDHIRIDKQYGIEDQYGTIFSVGNNRSDDWAFPNWRDFIGQTFERPKA